MKINYLSQKVCIGISLILTSVLLACSSTKNSKPKWIENPTRSYDERIYMVAMGTADNLQDAQNLAYGNLSKMFNADIEVSESLSDRMFEVEESNAYDFERRTTLLTISDIKSEESLINVSLLNSYTDYNGIVYALVGLKRLQTSELIGQEIANNQFQIENLFNRINETADPIRQLAYLKKAYVYALDNKRLAHQRSILSGQPLMGMTHQDLAEIQNKYLEIKPKSTFFVSRNNIDEESAGVISNIFIKEGFTESKDSTTALLLIDGNIDYNPIDMNRNDASFVLWNVNLTISDNKINQTLSTFVTEGRDGAVSLVEAVKRAKVTVRKQLNRDLKKLIHTEVFQ